jgi:predicted DNA-binding protein
MLTIELPEDISNRLELLSMGTGRSMQFYALEAIFEYLDEIEDKYMPLNRINDEGIADSGDLPGGL